ncbi:conserved hypothetical protein [Ricinus communis]|uniref:HTH cro/C1-type domain-containing protein n=1 Tax=Ricinus communis TaxID=3988 RepID=B9TQS8_RICCO|nr:conserved hypothetical protein [Ricinus communis]
MSARLTGRAPAHCLLDAVIALRQLKNDAHLSRLSLLAPSSISKIRRGHASVTAEVLLRLHEAFDIPIAELKRLLARQSMLDARAGAALAGGAD